ncbi:DUF4381 domain-containing protein [Vibrio sp. THAF190c]|uniref:DUF4381 domain-containing protein n=1 Tax=Vibrio sp. THAF190c TaxID=2587865 RepID=UPI001269638F|nr:DUF4381 domain-containing protein [Vibrio sp. THAF190c]QFT12567.1 hypothetical protein FIV04_21790 [Vibrio sp. THAF190c]
MSVEHTPPSTYILRDIQDVAVPDSVSWLPQTMGWKVLGVALIMALAYATYRYACYRWYNRYRQEALDVLGQLDPSDKGSAKRAFEVLKSVLRYLNARNASIHGEGALVTLDGYLPKKASTIFQDSASKIWIDSLINPSIYLTFEQRVEIIEKATTWVKVHQYRGSEKPQETPRA